jgi:hypothetical protein
MSGVYLDAEEVAEMLIEASSQLSRREFVRLLEDVLRETSTTDAAAIAIFMPEALQGLLPRRCLH